MEEDLDTGGDGSQQPQECGIGPGHHLVAKFVECLPFTLNRHLSRSDAGL